MQAVVEQRSYRCRASHTDTHRQDYAACSQPPEPAEYGLPVERELRNHEQVNFAAHGVPDFPVQCRHESRFRDLAMALRIPCDADAAYAMRLQQPCFEQIRT